MIAVVLDILIVVLAVFAIVAALVAQHGAERALRYARRADQSARHAGVDARSAERYEVLTRATAHDAVRAAVRVERASSRPRATFSNGPRVAADIAAVLGTPEVLADELAWRTRPAPARELPDHGTLERYRAGCRMGRCVAAHERALASIRRSRELLDQMQSSAASRGKNLEKLGLSHDDSGKPVDLPTDHLDQRVEGDGLVGANSTSDALHEEGVVGQRPLADREQVLEGDLSRVGAHESSPTVGRQSGGTADVAGASGVAAPGADVPTVGDPTDSGSVLLPDALSVVSPVGGGVPPASPSTAARRWSGQQRDTGAALDAFVRSLGVFPEEVDEIRVGPVPRATEPSARIRVTFCLEGCAPRVLECDVPL